MKAEILSDGMLKVRAETELERYALNRWSEDNEVNNEGMISTEHLLFDYSMPQEKEVRN